MWFRRSILFALQGLILMGFTDAFEQVYLTSLYDSTGGCDYQSDLEYGFTVALDPDNNFKNNEFAFRPGWIFDCTITFIGRPKLDGLATFTSLAFRENFIFADVGLFTTGTTPEECGKAFIQLYRVADYPNNPIWTHCSYGDLPGIPSTTGYTNYVYESPGTEHDLILRFFIDFNVQVINTASVNPNLTTTTLMTTPNPNDYPKIHFNADFTSYVHNDTCANKDSAELFRCKDSLRCLSKTDRCDVARAWNCRNNDFFNDDSDITDCTDGSTSLMIQNTHHLIWFMFPLFCAVFF